MCYMTMTRCARPPGCSLWCRHTLALCARASHAPCIRHRVGQRCSGGRRAGHACRSRAGVGGARARPCGAQLTLRPRAAAGLLPSGLLLGAGLSRARLFRCCWLSARAQDFFQLLRPGLQLLRPPKKSSAGQATVGGLVPYNADAFVAEFGVQPSQARRPALGL